MNEIRKIIAKTVDELSETELQFIRDTQLTEQNNDNYCIFTKVALALEARTKTHKEFSSEMRLLLERLYS